MLQTICFQDIVLAADGKLTFSNPTPLAIVSAFPHDLSLVVLSLASQVSRGPLGCTQIVEIDGTEIFRHEHASTLVPVEGGGMAFHLHLDPLRVEGPCTIRLRSVLSTGEESAAIDFPVLDRAMAFPALNTAL